MDGSAASTYMRMQVGAERLFQDCDKMEVLFIWRLSGIQLQAAIEGSTLTKALI